MEQSFPGIRMSQRLLSLILPSNNLCVTCQRPCKSNGTSTVMFLSSVVSLSSESRSTLALQLKGMACPDMIEVVSSEGNRYRGNHFGSKLICIMLVFALITPVFLSTLHEVRGATSGLTPGMWAHYSISGNESSGTVDALFTVEKISGDNVTFTDLDTFKDNRTTTDVITVSITSGPVAPSSGEYFVIAPNKKVGDLVYPNNSHYSSFPIQDITQRSYASSRRATAHVLGTNSSTAYVGNNRQTTSEDFYWDNPSGMFTEITKTLNNTVVLHVVMASTSVWPPDNPIDPYLVPSAIVSLTSAGLIGVIVVARYRRKPKRSH